MEKVDGKNIYEYQDISFERKKDILKQIIVDQKEMYLYNPIISRNYDLEDNVNYCFVGVEERVNRI